MTDAEMLLADFFEAYNRRDWPAFAAYLSPDIDWPDQTGDGRLSGQAALRAYWDRNDQIIQVEVTPLAFATLPDGRIRVDVNQVVRNTSGALWSDIQVRHFYTLRDGLVARMDVTPFEETDLAP
jgi:hypothetical protein